MIQETMKKLRGHYEFEIVGTDGRVREFFAVENLVTNAGFAQLALLAGDSTAVPFTYMALGTSSTAPAAGNTTLGAEISTGGLQRALGTFSRITTTVTNDTYRLVNTFTASSGFTVEEVGIFNASSSGTMLSRALTTSKTIASGETITGTYTLKFA